MIDHRPKPGRANGKTQQPKKWPSSSWHWTLSMTPGVIALRIIMWSLGVKGQTLTVIFLWTWFDYFDHVNSYLLFFSEPLCFSPCSLEQHLRWGHKVVSMGTRWWWFFQHPIKCSHTLVINVTGSAVDCTSACCAYSQQSQLPCYGGGHPVQLTASPQVLVPSFLSQTLQCKDGSHRVHTENWK